MCKDLVEKLFYIILANKNATANCAATKVKADEASLRKHLLNLEQVRSSGAMKSMLNLVVELSPQLVAQDLVHLDQELLAFWVRKPDLKIFEDQFWIMILSNRGTKVAR